MVSIFAFFVTTLVVVISARLSQQEKKKELMEQVKRYNELSRDASDVKAKGMYAAFQKQGNETLMQYFVAMYKEAIVEIALHVLAMGVLQKYFPVRVVDFPVSIWVFGDGLGSVGWYIVSAALFFFIFIKRVKSRVRFFRPGWV